MSLKFVDILGIYVASSAACVSTCVEVVSEKRLPARDRSFPL
jgi:hypothetical protein